MSHVGRVLTLRVTVTDVEAAEWIWKAHSGAGMHGVKVSAIQNGDLFEQADQLASAAEFFICEEGESVKDAVDAHFDGGFDTVDAAMNEVEKNVSLGAAWTIIDRRGTIHASSRPRPQPISSKGV